MNGVGDMPPSMSQSLSGMAGEDNMPNMMSQSMQVTGNTMPPSDLMTSSTSSLNMGPSRAGSAPPAKPRGRSAGGSRNQTSQNWFAFDDAESSEGRAESAAKEREREERLRKLREQQEDERKKKLEELKLHALSAQKFREQQEAERRRHIEGRRSNDMDRRQQVEERRKEIEKADQERREAILNRNKERDGRLETQRKNSRSNIDFAFGSSAPRMLEPRMVDSSSSGYWGSRSTIGPGLFDRRSAERETGQEARVKRTTSAQGLDRSTEGDDAGLVGSSVSTGGHVATAHRRRTDLVPTITMSRNDMANMSRPDSSGSMSRTGGNTPGRTASMSRLDQLSRPRQSVDNRQRLSPSHAAAGRYVPNMSPSKSMSHLAPSRQRGNMAPLSTNTSSRMATGRARARTTGKDQTTTVQGISRENSTTGSRPGSSLSAPRPNTAGGVRMRTGGGARRPRPLSIATTGMTASMYEERQKPAHVPRQKSLATPKPDRMKRARSVTSTGGIDDGGIDDDNRSTASSQSVGPSNRTPTRKTPSQVKAEAAARKAKASTGRSSGAGSTPKSSLGTRGAATGATNGTSKTPSPALSQDQLDTVEDKENKVRQSTPDIIKDNSKKAPVADPTPTLVADIDDKTEDSNRESEKEKSPSAEPADVVPNNEKKIITSEEEAKAKIAEKRRLMKEQKEREAELERLRLEEEARIAEEQRIKEEEEERKMIEETERLAAEGRRLEEERIRKAIQEKDDEDRRVREEEERLKKEKEELERKTKEEAEKREVELQEKLRKEEEERLARKKRIEEIMARTRGKAAAPKKPEEPVANQAPQEQPQEPRQPPRLDTNVDPTKPDLLGDISYKKVESVENAKNLLSNKLSSSSNDDLSNKSSSSSSNDLSSNGEIPSPTEPELEKGALDSISNKSIENDNSSSSPLITIENGEGPVKKSNGVLEGGTFDQILDLGSIPDSNKAEGVISEPPIPIIAFEENITSNNTADLLS